jgi:hypothetical protein
MTTIEAGSTAPDFIFATAEGVPRHLSAMWQEGPALVLWLRHFG